MAVVLVGDDEVGIANLLSDVLSDEGHRVLGAANGHEALKRAEEERPDLVITDFMMPVMDGAQLIKALADHPDLKDVSVFLMSSAPIFHFCKTSWRIAISLRVTSTRAGLMNTSRNLPCPTQRNRP